jgi:hypothetical protein
VLALPDSRCPHSSAAYWPLMVKDSDSALSSSSVPSISKWNVEWGAGIGAKSTVPPGATLGVTPCGNRMFLVTMYGLPDAVHTIFLFMMILTGTSAHAEPKEKKIPVRANRKKPSFMPYPPSRGEANPAD